MPVPKMVGSESAEQMSMPKIGAPEILSKMLPRRMTDKVTTSAVRIIPPVSHSKTTDVTTRMPVVSEPAVTGSVGANIQVFLRQGHELVPGTVGAAPSEVAADASANFQLTLRGSTTHFNVYYDVRLGGNGQILADGVLASCEFEYNTLVGYFGGIRPSSFNVIIAPGITGAYHYGCAATDLYCEASGVDVDFTRLLVVAEEVEVFSALQNRGWDCSASNGEGLSRVLAVEQYPGVALAAYGLVAAPTWLDTAGRPDFVDTTDPTDRNFVSIGCSVLFLNYLRYQLGYDWESIVNAGGSTLAQCYKNLTGSTDALGPFKALLQSHYPEGTPAQLTTDNPFPFQTGSEAWHAPESLGGYGLYGVAAASWASNRLDIFTVGGDHAMYHRAWDGSVWEPWEDLAGYSSAAPAAVSQAPNRINIFTISTNNDIFHRAWDGSVWEPWDDMREYGAEDGVAVASWGPERLDLFTIGADQNLYHQSWNDGAWGPLGGLGGPFISAPAAVSWGPNRIDVFALGTDHAVYHRAWDGSGWSSNWEALGAYGLYGLAAASWGPNRLDLFVIGGDHGMYHRSWNGVWSGWEEQGGYYTSAPAAVSWRPDRIDVFGLGGDSAVYHSWYG
jgi:hypothetical protein